MRLSSSFIAVRKIEPPDIPKSQYSQTQINTLAEQILASEGLINPLIVKRTSLESYQLVEGVLEYYAAVRAREMDPRRGEMINAFIVEGEKAESLQTQVHLLRQPKTPQPVTPPTATPPPVESPTPPSPPPSSVESQLLDYHSRLTHMELRFEKQLEALQQQQQTLLSRLDAMETEKTPEVADPLVVVNTLPKTELASRLRGLNTQQLNALIKAREQGEFLSRTDLQKRVKGVGSQTINKIWDDLS
ncbi:helix-hairpin-helix domain-containing protein [Spirulina sp. CS-785/01]|uniref:helix-hairpin-helix domain-containing protein n=1 Tax=Spirulina sp. CS-785/01 TaxID=3021716 RepID=UPI00232BD7ED|nr:helix-hairpin-helix domain-containing protein [Spirulina sp. CS-785/01]MDB9313201.1 helix-hairpin-helix domain-containing protein [Spirulina sp. CS-785/01]